MILYKYELSHLDLLTWSAVCASIICYCASSRTCLNIIRNKSTGDVPLFPFIASLYSGVIWLKYSLMVNSVQYAVANFINTVLQASYIVIYHGYCKDKRKCHKQLLVFITVLYALLFYAKYYPFNEVVKTLGFFGCFVTILMTGAPLVSLKVIIETRSTRILDFGFIIASFFSNLLWTLAGYYMSDINISLPNGVAFLLAVFQLSLFVVYPSNNSRINTSEPMV